MNREEKIQKVCEVFLKDSNCLRFQSTSSTDKRGLSRGTVNCIHCRAVVRDVYDSHTLEHEPDCPVTYARELSGWIPIEPY